MFVTVRARYSETGLEPVRIPDSHPLRGLLRVFFIRYQEAHSERPEILPNIEWFIISFLALECLIYLINTLDSSNYWSAPLPACANVREGN